MSQELFKLVSLLLGTSKKDTLDPNSVAAVQQSLLQVLSDNLDAIFARRVHSAAKATEESDPHLALFKGISSALKASWSAIPVPDVDSALVGHFLRSVAA